MCGVHEFSHGTHEVSRRVGKGWEKWTKFDRVMDYYAVTIKNAAVCMYVSFVCVGVGVCSEKQF